MNAQRFEAVCWLDRGWQSRTAEQKDPPAELVVVGVFDSKDKALQAGKEAFRIEPDYIAFTIRQPSAVEARA